MSADANIYRYKTRTWRQPQNFLEASQRLGPIPLSFVKQALLKPKFGVFREAGLAVPAPAKAFFHTVKAAVDLGQDDIGLGQERGTLARDRHAFFQPQS